jgi:hypothetical protein
MDADRTTSYDAWVFDGINRGGSQGNSFGNGDAEQCQRSGYKQSATNFLPRRETNVSIYYILIFYAPRGSLLLYLLSHNTTTSLNLTEPGILCH